jgi:ketosteroid isomerase-like protein
MLCPLKNRKEHQMEFKNPIDITLQFVEHINRQDLPDLVELMSEEHTFIDLAGDVHRGRETMQEGWAQYFSMCPQYMIHVSEVYLSDLDVILVGRTTGSHVQQPRHIEIQDTLIWVASIENDRVTQWKLYYDNDQNRAALGASPRTKITR